MRYRILHTTRYDYNQMVTLCHNEAHLRPRNVASQACEAWQLAISPAPARVHEHCDYFGNSTSVFAIQDSHQSLTVTATSTVQRWPVTAAPQLHESAPWEMARDELQNAVYESALEARHLTLPSLLVPCFPALAAYAKPSFPAGRPLLAAVQDLCGRIYRELTYDKGFTTVTTPLRTVLEERRGVCQDFAHLAIGCLRSLGLPARYVSGYIETLPPPGETHALRGADASHAWFAVFDPQHGWVDFDPTNDQIVGEQHVVLAWGRDYSDVAPLKGIIFGGGNHSLDVAVEMTRIEEAAHASTAPPLA